MMFDLIKRREFECRAARGVHLDRLATLERQFDTRL